MSAERIPGTIDPETGRRVAKDGSLRGRAPGRKNKASELLEQAQEIISDKYGVENWDPVVHMMVTAVDVSQDRYKLDVNGEIERDDEGKAIIVPANMKLSLDAAAKAAPFVRSTLKQIEVTDGEDGPIDADVVGAKARLAVMANIALADEEDEDADDEEGPDND